MRKILIYSLLFIFLTTQLQAHRVILKSGEQISGDLKETEGTSDHIIITTEGEDVKIFKKDIAELFFEEAGNHLCIHFKEEPESKCNLKLIRLNVNTLYYIDENNRYRRISFKDLESIRIEEPSTKILEQLSKTRFRIQIVSKDKKEIFSPIQSVKDETITVQNEPDVNPTLIPKEEIAFLFYKTTEEKRIFRKKRNPADYNSGLFNSGLLYQEPRTYKKRIYIDGINGTFCGGKYLRIYRGKKRTREKSVIGSPK